MIFGLDPTYTSWGPFINHETYIIPPVSRNDLITASIVFAFCGIFAASSAYAGYKQTRRSRRPWTSAYIWMIWLEWIACVIIGIESLLFLLRVIRPSFYFFMSLLVMWTIQTQCLLQIIINRIRIILHDRKKGEWMAISAFIYMALINISVFCIWIPARLQINASYMQINEIWDRIEKVLYLIIDAYLNYYFIRTVKINLVSNGLQKYNRLVRFNQGMIVVSLMMDMVILGAMSLPNGLVYAMFHPLAYLVKLNIEMSMARLIKKIALGSNDPRNASGFRSFNSSNAHKSHQDTSSFKTWATRQSSTLKSMFGKDQVPSMQDGVIQKTEEFTVHSTSRADVELQPQKYPGEKNVYISSVVLPEERSNSSKDTKDGKGSRMKHSMGDEETLIKPQPALLPNRKSEDSSVTPSMASDIR